MSSSQLIAVLITVSALLAWANYRFIRLVLSLVCLLIIVAAGHLGLARS